MNEISKDELRDIIRAVVERVSQPESDDANECIFSDAPGVPLYAIRDE